MYSLSSVRSYLPSSSLAYWESASCLLVRIGAPLVSKVFPGWVEKSLWWLCGCTVCFMLYVGSVYLDGFCSDKLMAGLQREWVCLLPARLHASLLVWSPREWRQEVCHMGTATEKVAVVGQRQLVESQQRSWDLWEWGGVCCRESDVSCLPRESAGN